MVDRVAETRYWVEQIASRVTVSPGEQLDVAEAAITAALMIVVDTLLDVRGQSDEADDNEMTCLVTQHYLPTVKALVYTSLDAKLGPVDVDSEILDEHYDGEI